MIPRERLGWVAKQAGGLLLILVLLTSLNGLRNPLYGMLSGGIGEGTRYHTTWNAVALILGLLLAGIGWFLSRSDG